MCVSQTSRSLQKKRTLIRRVIRVMQFSVTEVTHQKSIIMFTGPGGWPIDVEQREREREGERARRGERGA